MKANGIRTFNQLFGPQSEQYKKFLTITLQNSNMANLEIEKELLLIPNKPEIT